MLSVISGTAILAWVGDLASVHRIRAGRIARLTPAVPRVEVAPGIWTYPPASLLGWTGAAEVSVHDEPVEPGDLFVLSDGPKPFGSHTDGIEKALATLAGRPFDLALAECNRVVQKSSYRRRCSSAAASDQSRRQRRPPEASRRTPGL